MKILLSNPNYSLAFKKLKPCALYGHATKSLSKGIITANQSIEVAQLALMARIQFIRRLPMVAVVVISMVGYSSNSLARQNAVANNQSIPYKTSNGTVVSFQQVCNPPSAPGPVPIPYPNTSQLKGSDYKLGKNKTKTGESVVFSATKTLVKGRMQTFTEVKFLDKFNQSRPIHKSTLFSMADGSYCAVCMKGQKITRVLKLYPVEKDTKKAVLKYKKPQLKKRS